MSLASNIYQNVQLRVLYGKHPITFTFTFSVSVPYKFPYHESPNPYPKHFTGLKKTDNTTSPELLVPVRNYNQ